jgi:hypothetical protein
VAEQRGAADQVREVLEAADRVRAQADADARRTRGAVDRVGERAEELRRRLDELSAAVTEAIAGLREELESLREEAEAAPVPAKPDVAAAVAAEPTPTPEAPAPEGARLLALKMALDGRPRDETAAYLRDNFELDDPEALLDEVYAQAGS